MQKNRAYIIWAGQEIGGLNANKASGNLSLQYCAQSRFFDVGRRMRTCMRTLVLHMLVSNDSHFGAAYLGFGPSYASEPVMHC